MAKFQEKDEQAHGILLTSLDDNYIHYLDECNSALQAWNILERHFGAKAKSSKIALKMQLYGLIMNDNEDLATLINHLKSIATQLTYIKVSLEEEDLVAILLKAVPNEPYGRIVIVLKEKDPTPSLEDVINLLQDHKKKKDPKQENGAYMVSSSNKPKCGECGKTNHATKDCYRLILCSNFGKKGHPSSKCYMNEDNSKGKAKVNDVEEHNPPEPQSSNSLNMCYYDDIL